MELRPHDLLRIADAAALLYPEDEPSWIASALARAPYVVVRRARAAPDQVAVGIRGRARNERCAAMLPLAAIERTVTPESLVADRAWETVPRRASSHVLRALPHVADILTPLALPWGPTGSAGFELASGVPTTSETSDLDLLLRSAQPFSRPLAQRLVELLASLPVRVDVQVETAHGAFVLGEYAQSAGCVLLRTAEGPRLVDDPWSTLEDAGVL